MFADLPRDKGEQPSGRHVTTFAPHRVVPFAVGRAAVQRRCACARPGGESPTISDTIVGFRAQVAGYWCESCTYGSAPLPTRISPTALSARTAPREHAPQPARRRWPRPARRPGRNRGDDRLPDAHLNAEGIVAWGGGGSRTSGGVERDAGTWPGRLSLPARPVSEGRLAAAIHTSYQRRPLGLRHRVGRPLWAC